MNRAGAVVFVIIADAALLISVIYGAAAVLGGSYLAGGSPLLGLSGILPRISVETFIVIIDRFRPLFLTREMDEYQAVHQIRRGIVEECDHEEYDESGNEDNDSPSENTENG